MREQFFNSLNYSSCNEDPASELKALEITPGDSVACVTGSGDRPLHMLLGGPEQVIAFDLNKVQNFLLELKMTAIRKLAYPDFIFFLGVRGNMQKQNRKEIFKTLKQDLSDDAAHWFDRNLTLIESGILYAGRWERYFRLSSRFIRLWRWRKVEKLFSLKDLDGQRVFWRKEWDTRLWRLFLKLTFNTLFFKTMLRDPGFYSQLQDDAYPSFYIHQKMNRYLQDHLARESFMLALVFLGRFTSADHYPPYLRQENYPILQNRIERVSIHNVSIEEAFENDELSHCNKYSLSDIASFLDQRSYKILLTNLSRRPDRRFCLREFLTSRGVPADCPSNIAFFPALQKELEQQDRSFGYTFLVGETR